MRNWNYSLLLLIVAFTGCRQEKAQPEVEKPDTFLRQNQQGSGQQQRQAIEEAEPIDLLKQRVGKGTSDRVLQRQGYVTSYNKRTRTPNWVAWTLTKAHTYGRQQRSEERFEEDLEVAEPRATFQDYYNTGYDRGHMCPAGDNKWSQEAMMESFLMTNICPQNHGLNKEDWNDLEIQCRSWAREYGEVTIVCGPLFEYEGDPRRIGKNKVMVPTGFFKVLYCAEPEPRTLGFIFKNNGKRQPWRQQVCTVDEVESRTGFDLFYLLADDVETAVEAEADLKAW